MEGGEDMTCLLRCYIVLYVISFLFWFPTACARMPHTSISGLEAAAAGIVLSPFIIGPFLWIVAAIPGVGAVLKSYDWDKLL